jgi:hypothetical protein
MKALIMAAALMAAAAGYAAADPAVDGSVAAGEYAHSQTLLGGKLVLSWQGDADGGLYLAVSARTNGWVAVGLGSQKMDGSVIFIGSVKDDGTPAFSEDSGKGHGHSPASARSADQSAVAAANGWTTVEVHVPAGSLPFTGASAPFIVAYSGSKDITTWHGLFNHASGTLTLP